MSTKPAVPVLIVDDIPAKRLTLQAVLSPLGYSVVEANSGRDAVRCVMAPRERAGSGEPGSGCRA